MGLDLVFVRQNDEPGNPVPEIPRYTGHDAFLAALGTVPCDSFWVSEPDGVGAFRPWDIGEAVRAMQNIHGCQPGHLRILWQLRHDPSLFLVVSF